MFKTTDACVEPLESRRLLAAGDLDPGFGQGGIVRAELYPPFEPSGRTLVIQGDGKLLTGGSFSSYRDYDPFPAGFAVARKHPDGTADLAFGDDGYVNAAVPGAAAAAVTELVIQSDGKIVAAGWALVGGDNRFAVARFNPDGSPDAGFSGDGFVTFDFTGGNDTPSGVAVDPRNGRIVVAGTSSLDTAAADFAFARLLPDGALDPSFNGNGLRTMDIGGSRQDQANAVLVQPDGRIVAGGSRKGPSGYTDFVVVRLTAAGADDNTFTTDGRAITDFQGGNDRINDLAFGPGGSIVAVGSARAEHPDSYPRDDYALARYTPGGVLDTAFGGGDGKVQTDDGDGSNNFWESVAVAPDGRIVTAGSNRHDDTDGAMIAGRYLPDGTLDAGFASGGLFYPGDDFSTAFDVAVQSDGRAVIVGRAGSEVGPAGQAFWRLTTAGTRDEGFGRGTGQTAGQINGRMEGFQGGVSAFTFQSDGKVLAAGDFDPVVFFPYEHVGPRYALARYNADGTLDTSFADKGLWSPPGDLGSAHADAVAALTGGKILVVGTRGDEMFAARLNPDGSIDTSYGAGGIVTAPSDRFQSVAVAADGAFVVARVVRSGISQDATSRIVARRYTASGQPHAAFGPGEKTLEQFGPGVEVGLTGTALDGSGRILAAWSESEGEVAGRGVVARYTPGGSPDPGFGAGGVASLGQGVGPYDLIVDSAGRPLVAADAETDNAFEVMRLTTTGAPDAAFGSGGTARVDFGLADNLRVAPLGLALQQDGRVIAAGSADGGAAAVARLTSSGQIDRSFHGDGRTTVPLSVPRLPEVYPAVVAVDRQGRVVLGGANENQSLGDYQTAPVLVRLQGGGAPVLPGDINGDGSVNGSDFSILAGNFGKSGMTAAQGDLNGDGRVDGSDFAILAANFGKTAGA